MPNTPSDSKTPPRCPRGKDARGRRIASGFLRNIRGAAAVEFAFIVPILLTLYLGSMEISQALDVDKRVGRTASMVADLVTQQEQVNRSQLVSIMKIGDATLQPYNRSTPATTIVAVQVDSSSSPKALAVWSIKRQGNSITTPVAAGSTVTLPPDLVTAGAFIIMVTTKLDYVPITTWAISGTSTNGHVVIPMGETYYLRPRLADTIACSDC